MEEMPMDGSKEGCYKIVADVIRQEGSCSFGHRVGDTVVFDTVAASTSRRRLPARVPSLYRF